MKIEDRLSDALHGYADRIEPEAGSWARIASQFDESPTPSPRPTRGPLVLAGVALALIVVLITVLVVRDDGDNSSRVVTQPDGGAVEMPSRILAVNTDGVPVVLQSTDGVRLTEFPEAGPVVPDQVVPGQIAVSPDGKDAYVGRGDAAHACAGHSILRLPIGAGARADTQVATDATFPTVSRDGRYLAYLRCDATADRSDAIVLLDLTSGVEQSSPAPAGQFFSSLTFAPDSRHVLSQLNDDQGSKGTLHELDVVGRETVPGRTIPIGPKILAAGYLGATGELIGEDAHQLPAKVVALSAATGSPLRTITTFPESFGGVSADPSGRHLLLRDGQTLYRWSVGDAAPTKLPGQYAIAEWIPDAAPAAPPVDAATAPVGVLIAKRGGEMVVVGAEDGAQHSSLGTFPDVSSVSASADGRQVFFAATGQSGACGKPRPYQDVTRLVPATGAKTRVVGGALSPTVSPDGTLIAYGISCEGPGLGFTNLLTGENSRSDALGSKANETDVRIRTVEPLGWSPDATELLYRLVLKGDANPHYYVGRLWPAVRQSETKVTELPSGSNVTAAAFVDNDTVALAVGDQGQTKVQQMPIAAAGADLPNGFASAPQQALLVQGDGLFEVPGRVTSLVADASGRHFLALTEAGDLYRWSRGEDQPTKVASDVAAATWLPWS